MRPRCSRSRLRHFPAVAASPPTLSGETLLDPNPQSSGPCPEQFAFFAQGPAAGPYPGTFTENGSIDFRTGIVSARFRIDSPAGRVTGVKALVPGMGQAQCVPGGEPGANTGAVAGPVRYLAVIETPDGRRFRDRGTGTISFSNQPGSGVDLGFTENFQSDLVRPAPIGGDHGDDEGEGEGDDDDDEGEEGDDGDDEGEGDG